MRQTTLLIGLLVGSVFSHAQRDTTYYVYENLGPQVNSEYNESGPRISPDGTTLYFFRSGHPDNGHGTNDVWTSHNKDGNWSKAVHVGDPINNYSDNCVHSISADNKQLLVHDIYQKNKTSRSGVSMTSQKDDGSWTFPKALKIKDYKNDSRLTSFYLSDDWEVLILAIETEESIGKQDLYVSFHDADKDTWSAPLDLGTTINSAGAEATAFLSHDDMTLYFSSDGHPNSLGGMDIYKSSRLDSTRWDKWSTPQNLGAPYNTPDDEYYFSLPSHSDGWAYLAHSHHHGHSDITRIKKVIEPLPPRSIIITGIVTDIQNGRRKAASIDVALEGESLPAITTDSISPWKLKGKEGEIYDYEVKVAGYLPKTGKLDMNALAKKGEVNIKVEPLPDVVEIKDVEVDEETNIIIANIEFETDKYNIRPQFFEILGRVQLLLESKPDIIYQVVGHTDNVGSDEDNLALSDNRANEVKEYLIKKGIDPNRLQSKGLGESSPMATNETTMGRQRNRRVEFVPVTQ